MNQVRMGVDQSMAVVSARRTLRRLELEAYASVMSAFRAQGPLTGDKKSSLDQLGKHLGISAERHRAEVRRAVNDELLSAVAGCICPADSEILWRKEGQKLASTNPRFVARQLPHLPQLLTSAAVSSALGLQNTKVDPNLKKSTSAQVQNVLKFIISQNPLNSATSTKQQLGKLSLPTSGKTVKSPSKSPVVSVTSTPTISSTGQQLSAPPTTSPSPQPAASPVKTAVKEEKAAAQDNTPSAVSTSSIAKVVNSDTTKLSRVSAGVKSSMLVGLLEARMSADGNESQASASGMGNGGTSIELPAEEKTRESVREKLPEIAEGKEVSKPMAKVVEKEAHQQVAGDKEVGETGLGRGEDVSSDVGDAGHENKMEKVTTELECEEMMPELAVVRGTATVAGSAPQAQPKMESEAHSPPLKDHSPPLKDHSPPLKDHSPPLKESVTHSLPLKGDSAGTVDHVEGNNSHESADMAVNTNELGSADVARKRPCPTDLPLPPSKTPRLNSPPVPQSPIPASSSLPALTPVPTVSATVQSTTPAMQSVTLTPAGHLPSPPPLLLIPPSSDPNTNGSNTPFPAPAPTALKLFDNVPLLTPPSSTSLPLASAIPSPAGIQSEMAPRQPPPIALCGVASSAGVDVPSTVSSAASLVTRPSSADSHMTPTPTTGHLPLPLISTATTPLPAPATTSDTDLQLGAGESSTTDEALIRELCSEATKETTAAALASQLGLGFLEQSFLGGMDLMQLVQSPFEANPPSLGNGAVSGSATPTSGTGLPPLLPVDTHLRSEGEGDTPVLPDTTQLLSEALTSLSTPSTPILPPSSLPPLPPALFPGSPLVLTTCSPELSTQPSTHAPTLTSSIITPHSSPFTPHTPSILTPHTPSISSPLTPEILPDLESLSDVNEADLLRDIPPEIAETIQALAQFDQQNYHSPLQ